LTDALQLRRPFEVLRDETNDHEIVDRLRTAYLYLTHRQVSSILARAAALEEIRIAEVLIDYPQLAMTPAYQLAAKDMLSQAVQSLFDLKQSTEEEKDILHVMKWSYILNF
jgi:hypothetical protein